MAKKERKLGKEINGNVVKITELITNTVMEFDVTKLPKEILEKLPAFAIAHKLGDSAAGVAGQEAVDNIKKVWDGLMAGNWAVRGERGPSVSVAAINGSLDKLPPAEAAAAKALLLKLGIIKADAPKPVDPAPKK